MLFFFLLLFIATRSYAQAAACAHRSLPVQSMHRFFFSRRQNRKISYMPGSHSLTNRQLCGYLCEQYFLGESFYTNKLVVSVEFSSKKFEKLIISLFVKRNVAHHFDFTVKHFPNTNLDVWMLIVRLLTLNFTFRIQFVSTRNSDDIAIDDIDDSMWLFFVVALSTIMNSCCIR